MLILKQNAANTVPTPPAGKGTIFLDDSDVLSVKTSDGNVENFPTVAASNAQVVFINGTALSGEAAFTYDFNNNILTVTGNIAAGNVKTDNLLYANGTPWDLSDPGGSNTQIQFNDDESFGGSAAFTFNKTSNLVTVAANLNANNLNATTHITSGNVWANSGTVGASLLTGTLTTAAQPNVTSVGTLTDLNVGGNAIVGGNLTVNGNLVYVNVETIAVEDPIIQLQTGPNGAAPSSNSGKDVGSALNYYDSQARVAFMGWDVSNAEFGLASQASITNEVVTFSQYGNLRVNVIYANGAGLTNIPGGNITGNISGNISNADYATAAGTAGTVTTNAQPNITSVGTLSSLAVTANVVAGNVYANSGIIGAQNLKGEGGNISNIQGANVSGTVSSATTAGTVTTAAQPNITSVGTLSSLSVTGNVTAGNVKTDNLLYANGNPWDLSDPGGSNTEIQFNDDESFGGSAAFTFNKTSNLVSVSANLNANNLNATTHVTAGNVWANSGTVGASLLTGTLTTAAQPNVTSLGTLTSLTISGNATVGNLSGANLISANYLAGELTTNNQPSITGVGTLGSLAVSGNATAGNVYANSGTVGASLLTGTLTTAAQPNITSVGTLTSLTVSGNISGGNITGGALANGNSNVNIPAAAGNVNISVNGTANVAVVTATGVNVAGTLNATGNANVGNLGTGGLIVATGNVTGGNLVTSGALSVTGNANVGNLGTGGLITATGNVTGGNITTAGQLVSSISTGTAPLVVSSTTKVANLNADLLDGYSTATAATANTVVIRDADGSFSANIITGTLSGAATTAGTVTTAAQPNITSVGTLTSLTVSGNANVGNLGTAGLVVATGNVTGGNLVTSGALSVTGNANVGNLGTAGLVVATGNVTGGNLVTSGVLSVTGNANVGNLGTAGLIVATGNVTGGNLVTSGALSVTGNANVGNLGAAAGVFTANVTAGNVYANTGTIGASLLTGTLTTAAQPNITSVGTLTSLAVTGNATAGNVYANSGTIGASLLTGTLTTAAQPNVTSVGTLTSLSVTGNVAAGNLTTTGILSVTGTGTSSIAGNLDMTGNTISNLATPTASTDAATKQYVDDVAQGLNIHDSCAAATPDTLANVTGGTITYNNGTAGVGAFLATTGTFNLIDGVNVQTAGTRILVKNEANAVHNGIYTYTNTTAITRAADFNSIPEVEAGDFTFITGGTLYNDTGWVQTESPTGIGTAGNNISFTQFSGAGTYTAGTGLTLTGSAFSVNASQTQVTALGTVTTGTWNSLVGSSATFAAGLSGANLASITGANVTGTVGSATTAGTVTTAAQPNITSVGTLTSLTVSGNASAGNLNTAGAVVASTLTSNVATGTAPLTVTSTTRVGNLNVAYANVADFMNVTTQSSGNAYLLLGNALTGNISETANATFVANTSNGALYATTFVGALSGAATSATTAGTVTTAAQPNITSTGTLTSLTVSGNITAQANITLTSYMVQSVATGISAAGTAQGNATALTKDINVVSTVASGAGVVLPTAVAGMRLTIMNTAANALAVYPASTAAINSLSANAAFTQGAGARLDFVAVSTTQWYTLNATYA